MTVQWIQGSSEVAEASFFKINSQGTVLDDTEELLLRNRRKSYAVAARSIVRSGSGHKYWSNFDAKVQEEIEQYAASLNKLFFQPEVTQPIKTLDLPLGGTASPVDALERLVDIFGLVDGYSDASKAINSLSDDEDGKQTISTLKKCLKVASRMTGNDGGSLGLHPAVYFYTEQGKHSRFLFLGVVKAIADQVRSNNKAWFSKFTKQRKRIEKVFINKKVLINQGLSNVSNRDRINRVSELLSGLVDFETDRELTDEDVILLLKLKGQPSTLQPIDYITDFVPEAKSAIFLKSAITTATKCPLCGGLISVTQSVSYDHIKPVSMGGDGSIENGQLMHPYCNQAVKGAQYSP